jgi:hypothetical protein
VTFLEIPGTGSKGRFFYTGGTQAGGLETRLIDYSNAKIDFTGLEFSIGIIFSGQ